MVTITEDYVSFEVAKLLKDKGFGEWCSKCYSVAVRHNGADIDLDEEYELKSEGRESEIEYVEGGRLHNHMCNNNDKDAKIWAAPTMWVAIKWLREVHNLYTSVLMGFDVDNPQYYFFVPSVTRFTSTTGEYITPFDENEFDTYEEACEAAIKYCLENLI